MFPEDEMMELIDLSKKLQFKLFAKEMEMKDENGNRLLSGLQEFREHLGGELTIMLLKEIGLGIEVNEIDDE